MMQFFNRHFYTENKPSFWLGIYAAPTFCRFADFFSFNGGGRPQMPLRAKFQALAGILAINLIYTGTLSICLAANEI